MITLNKGDRPQVDEHGNRPHIAHWIRWLSVPIILGWLALTVFTNIAVPQVEVVGQAQSVPMAAPDAPSTIAMNKIGKTFQEFDSNTSVMIVLEGQQPLGDAAHQYYDEIVGKLNADTEARRAHPGLLGRPADRGGLAERATARPPTFRPIWPATWARAWPTSRWRRSKRDRRRHASAAGGQGVRHRSGGAGRRHQIAGDRSLK